MMLTTDWPSVDSRLPGRLFHAALGVSGLYDLEPLTRAPFLKDVMTLPDRELKALSPVHLRPADSAPMWIAVGSDETREFHRQARLLESAWGAPAISGVIDVPGRHHFSVCEGLAREDDPLAMLLFDVCGAPRR
jgi:arylformamidase